MTFIWQYSNSMNEIYSGLSDRLFLLNEKNKCIYLKNLPTKGFYDLHSCEDITPFLENKSDYFSFDIKIESNERLYVGYPFLTEEKNIKINAPLLFYPVRKEDDRFVRDGDPVLNRAVFLARKYGKRKKLFKKVTEMAPLSTERLLALLTECGYNFIFKKTDMILPMEITARITNKGIVRRIAVLGKFSIATALQEEYCLLQKNNSVNNTLLALFNVKNRKGKEKKQKLYYTEELDHTQEKALSAQRDTVIFGPPGTGKSQTISAIVGNEAAHKKTVLVVCEKKTALDVLYSRLHWMKESVLYLNDPLQSEAFYRKAQESHRRSHSFSRAEELKKTENILRSAEQEIMKNDSKLNADTSFGISLQKMYGLSASYPKDKEESELYDDLPRDQYDNYEKISDRIRFIKNSQLIERFCEYEKILEKNPYAKHIADVDVTILNAARNCAIEKYPPFPFEKHECSRLVLPLLNTYEKRKKEIASTILSFRNTYLYHIKKMSYYPLFWVLAPIIQPIFISQRNKVLLEMDRFINEWEEYTKPLSAVKKMFDKKGWDDIIQFIANGADCRKIINATVDNYLSIKTLTGIFVDVQPEIKELLLYCYKHSDKTPQSMRETLDKILPISIYKHLSEYETDERLLSTKQFDALRNTIRNTKIERTTLTRSEVMSINYDVLHSYLRQHPEKAKNYLFRIYNPTRSIKDTFTLFYDFILKQFPCIMVSPECIDLLPLKKDMFDTVIFDEASQLYLENAIPAVYRAKRMVVCGDNKQLPPPAHFSRKYEDIEEDISICDTLEAKSLLDLAMSRFPIVHLQYHYRSRYSELIDFSNEHFYNSRLFIAPNVEFCNDAIEWIKVNGKRKDGKNEREAAAVIKAIENNYSLGSIGVITFNVEQMESIKEKIDNKCRKDHVFKENWHGFVKNIEGVQGEECDLIIFSTGYAPDESGRIFARYGALGTDGGERRLNVAVTRARKKTIVITSLEPNELPVRTVKNEGPKLLQKYLEYTKNRSAEPREDFFIPKYNESEILPIERQIIDKLTRIGYVVHPLVGTTGYKMSMAIFDEKDKRYLLGIECDVRSKLSEGESEDKEIDKIAFLEKSGWTIYRVWSHDWWLSNQNVLSDICMLAEQNRLSETIMIPSRFRNHFSVKRETRQDVALEYGKK